MTGQIDISQDDCAAVQGVRSRSRKKKHTEDTGQLPEERWPDLNTIANNNSRITQNDLTKLLALISAQSFMICAVQADVEMRRSRHIRMPQNTGHGGDADAVFDRPGRKGVADRMELDLLGPQLAEPAGEVMLEVVRVGHAAALTEDDEVIPARDAELLCKPPLRFPRFAVSTQAYKIEMRKAKKKH